MKRVLAILSCAAGAACICAAIANARPPYTAAFQARYVKGSDNEEFMSAAKEAKCNVCHDIKGKVKKVLTEYGKAMGKHITEAEYRKLTGNKAALTRRVQEALEATERDKNTAGKTFGEFIKEGKLPGE